MPFLNLTAPQIDLPGRPLNGWPHLIKRAAPSGGRRTERQMDKCRQALWIPCPLWAQVTKWPSFQKGAPVFCSCLRPSLHSSRRACFRPLVLRLVLSKLQWHLFGPGRPGQIRAFRPGRPGLKGPAIVGKAGKTKGKQPASLLKGTASPPSRNCFPGRSQRPKIGQWCLGVWGCRKSR